MKTNMSRRLLLTLILALTVALPDTMLAVDNFQPLSVKGRQTAPGTAPKRLALAIVTAVQDSLLTIKVNNVAHNIVIDDKTKITRSGVSLQPSDIKKGMKVRISFIERTGSKVATTIDVRSDAEPEATAPPPAPPTPPSPPTPPGSRATRTIR
jgi:hypothetical protein